MRLDLVLAAIPGRHAYAAAVRRLVNRPQRQPAVPSFAEEAVGEAEASADDEEEANGVPTGTEHWVRVVRGLGTDRSRYRRTATAEVAFERCAAAARRSKNGRP